MSAITDTMYGNNETPLSMDDWATLYSLLHRAANGSRGEKGKSGEWYVYMGAAELAHDRYTATRWPK